MDRKLDGLWRRDRRFAPFAGAAGGLALAIATGFDFLGRTEPTLRV
jgi:hypothetical protein